MLTINITDRRTLTLILGMAEERRIPVAEVLHRALCLMRAAMDGEKSEKFTALVTREGKVSNKLVGF